MRFSQLFGKTLREAPADTAFVSEGLAGRAALRRRVGAVTVTLPIGFRVSQRIRAKVREALSALGGQELSLPPGLSYSHFRADIASYRDLPRTIFDATSQPITALLLCPDEASLTANFRAIYQSLLDVFRACGLQVSAVEAGEGGTAWVIAHDNGDDDLLICESIDCGYGSLAEWAQARIPDGIGGEAGPRDKVATPHCPTIAALADYLRIETRQTLKAVLYMLDEREFVFVVIRGDLDVSETKVRRVLGGGSLRPATEAEIVAAGAVPGYASPAGLNVAASNGERGPGRVTVLADPSIQSGANFAAGANESGYHFINVNHPRDFAVTTMADIALAHAYDPCAHCNEGRLREQRAVVIGECHRWGTTELTFLNDGGRPQPAWAADFAVEADKVLLMCIDQNHDGLGIVWPSAVAPFDIHLVRLGKAPETTEAADKLYAELKAAGKEVLYDDRDESAGVKFADSDLIGIPLRVTVSDKSLKAGGAEVKHRNSAEKSIAPLDSIGILTP